MPSARHDCGRVKTLVEINSSHGVKLTCKRDYITFPGDTVKPDVREFVSPPFLVNEISSHMKRHGWSVEVSSMA